MNKSSVIKALQFALNDSLEVIAFLKGNRKDPKLDHAIEQISQALRYSEYVYEDQSNHPLPKPNIHN